MHVADVDASVVDSRVGAMHTVNPFHTFMFDCEGVLLNANVKALEAFARCTTGDALGLPFAGNCPLLQCVVELHHSCLCTAVLTACEHKYALLQLAVNCRGAALFLSFPAATSELGSISVS